MRPTTGVMVPVPSNSQSKESNTNARWKALTPRPVLGYSDVSVMLYPLAMLEPVTWNRKQPGTALPAVLSLGFIDARQDCKPDEMDLHGLYVKEAVSYVDKGIQEARQRGDAEIRLIVGKSHLTKTSRHHSVVI